MFKQGILQFSYSLSHFPPPHFILSLSVFQEKDTSLYQPALEELRRQIRSSTTSMTSVPKPLKFLRPHYGKLKEIFEAMAPGENKVRACMHSSSYVCGRDVNGS